MSGISIGSVSVSVVPDLRGFTDKLRSALLPQSDALGAEIGRRIADGINASLRGVTITANVAVDTAAARAALDELGSKSVAPRVTLDDSRIVEALEDLGVRLDELNAEVTNVRVELESGSTVERLDEISLKLDEIGARDVTAKLGLDDSSFNRQLDEDMAKLDAAGSAGGGFGRGALLGAGILGAVTAGPAIPGALTGAGASVASLGLAYEGVSGVLKDYTAAQNTAATATGNSAKSATSAATQIRSAQVAVSNAETQAAHDAVTSAEAVRNAQAQAARDAVTSAETVRNAQLGVSQAVTQAAQNQVSAEEQLATAQYAEKQAQQALTDARQQAILTLQQLHDAEADTALGVEQAQLDLEQAKLNAQKTDASATATALQKAQADLTVREAQQRLKEAIQAKASAANAANKADKEGVSGMPAVVSAQHNLAQAHQSAADAQRNLVNVERQGAAAIAKAEQSLADAVRAASWQRAADAQRVADASRNASWQQQADGQRVTDAQYNLQAAYAAASAAAAGHPSSAATAAQKYALALAALSPAGRQLVTDIIGIKNALKPLEGAAEKGIAPGFTVLANGIRALSPLLAAEVTRMNTILGGFLTSIGHAFASSSFQATLKSLFAEGNQFIQILTPALGQMVKAFLEMGAKSAPAVKGLADGLAAIARGLGDLFTSLAPAAPAIGSVLRSLGEAVGAIGGPLGTVLGDLMTALAPILQTALPVFRALLDSIAGAVTPLVNELLPPLRDVLAAIGPPLTALAADAGQLAAGLIRAAGPLLQLVGTLAKDLAPVLPGIVGLLSSLAGSTLSVLAQAVRVVAPPLETLVNSVFKALQPVLPQLEASLAQIGGILAGLLGQAVKALVPYLTQSVQQFGRIFAALVPLLPPLLKLTALLVDLAAKAITPLLPLIGEALTAMGYVTAAIAVVIGWIAKIIAATLNWIVNIDHWKHAFGDAWNWVVSNVFNPMKTFFLSTIPGWFDATMRALKDRFTVPFQNAFAAAWTWLVNNFGAPVQNFLTKTLPGWFASAVTAIGSVWGRLESVVRPPVSFIVNTIFDKGIVPVVNAVGSLIGLHLNPVKFAAGGKVTQGTTATADDVLARISKGETVVSAEHSRQLAPVFEAVGVPGYAAGGVPGGGILHDITSGLSGIVKTLAGLTGSALGAAARAVLNPLLGAMPGGGTVIGADLKKIPEKMISGLVDRLTGTGAVVGSPIGGNFSSGSLTGAIGGLPANWRAIVSYLAGNGFSQAEAAGIAGNIDIESGGNPNIWQVGGGGGYGLIQWTPPPPGLVGSGLGGELAQIAREGTGMFRNPKNPAEAAFQYLMGRERPADPASTAAAREASANAVAKAMGWKFDDGGWMPPGLSLNLNGTGRPEPVLSGRQWDLISSAVAGGDGAGLGGRQTARKLDRMIDLLERAPAQTAGGVGQALNGTARGAVHAGYFRTR